MALKKSHLAFIVGGALALGLVGYLAYTPYQTSNRIRAAVVAQKPDELLNYVDTDAVQAHFKTHFQQQLQQDLKTHNAQSNLLVLGEAMGEVMVERFSWEYGTREAIVRTLLNGEPTKRDGALVLVQPTPIEKSTRGYKGLGRFQIDVPGKTPISVVLTRRGLGWKVTEVNFNP